nr:glycosyl hydrolase [Massilia sp. JS1662]
MKNIPLALTLCASLCAGYVVASPSAQSPDLAAGFRNPPHAAKVQVWWHWMNGNVDIDGARLDLAWMQKVGVGGVHIFSGGGFYDPVVPDPKPFMSNEWRGVFKEATRIANDYGMDVTIAGSPGWSQTGGPWVPAHDAMKKYVWSETRVEQGQAFDGYLKRPPTTSGPFGGILIKKRANLPPEALAGYYRDAHVVAFPTPPSELAKAPSYSIAAGPVSLAPIEDGTLSQAVALPISETTRSAFLQADFVQAVTVSALTLGIDARTDFDIQVLDNGQFRTVSRVTADPAEQPSPQQTYRFSPTTGKTFRVVFRIAAPRLVLPDVPPDFDRTLPPPKAFSLTRFKLETGARANRFEAKAGFQSTIDFAANTTPATPDDQVIPASAVLDLTDKLDENGRLNWTPPPGNWTILRLGYTLTGHVNNPAEASATGLEVDKLDPVAVRTYIEHYLSMYGDAVGDRLGNKNIGSLLTDSWEAGVQNWTPALLREFAARRGYDAVPYLPILAGYIVHDAQSTDKFLWDFRQTLKQMLVENHNAVIAASVHAHGMTYYTEAQGDYPRAIADGMTMKARADIPTGEFWYRPFATGPGQPGLKADLEESASVAHLYGKPLVAAEALTVAAGFDPWAFSPAMLKPVADEIFAHGVNRVLMHDSHHQPFVDKKPGLMLLYFGQFFNRNETWADEAKPWLSYLSRTSYMLQQGHYVADVAYFYGEEKNLAEIFEKKINTDVPKGYQYDYVNPEALMTLLDVRDGRLVTPSGMSYRVLYLPDDVKRMTLPVLRKIRDLVSAGAVVVGPKPVEGLGLRASDAAIRQVADEIWGDGGNDSHVHGFGKGRVYTGMPLSQVLEREQVAPRIVIANADSPGAVMSLYRRTASADIYFISNQSPREQALKLRFPVADKIPSVWHAEDASVTPVSYHSVDGGTEVPLSLEPHQALFVVFDGKRKHKSFIAPSKTTTLLAEVKGPWRVSFQSGRGAPASAVFDTLISWPTSSDAGIKYFSGAATYRQTLDVPKRWLSSRRRILLDLGEVRELAVISLNGKVVGTAWHPPYKADITKFVRVGANRLEVKVINLWPNRLIGDQQPGATTYTYAPQAHYKASSPLLPSGLLGPVTIKAEK